MNNPLLKFFALLIPAVFLGLLFSCEEKDPEYPVEITVKYLSDTTKVVPGAMVYIGKYMVAQVVASDINGKANATFEHEAILDVKATIDTGTGPVHFYGETTIRLKADKTVYRSVFIAP